jgi:hypothetical protein
MRFVVLGLFATVMLVGCGGSGDLDRVVVTGKVTYNGEPIKNGEIRFVPIKDTRGPVSGGSIVNGVYTAKGLGGVPIGTYRVVIRASRAVKGAKPESVGDDPSGEEYVRGEQYVPEKYNVKSELELTVPAGNRRITQDYNLVD